MNHIVVVVLVDGAPGGTRTHTVTVLSRLPLPIGLRGRMSVFSQRVRDPVEDVMFADDELIDVGDS